jgi:CelD/BcsL family acetyltransferase involved in cellulose biosynthesis
VKFRANTPHTEPCAGEHTTTVVTTRRDFEALKPEWDALLVRTGNVLPFYLHDWLTLWWDHLRQSQLTVRDSLRVATVRNAAGELVAVHPMMLTERPSIGPVRARTLQSLGADPYVTELKGPIVDPGDAASARALVRHWEASHEWDWISWSGLLDESAFAREIEAHASVEVTHVWPDYVLPLAASWEEFRKGLKRNIRESLRHCYNSLKRDGLEFTFEVASDPASTSRALAHFFRLHALRADVTDTVAHPNRFAPPATARFLEAVVARLSAAGIAKVFTLTIGGEVVAARIGFHVGSSLYLYYSGYDPAFRKHSIMTTTVAEALRWAMDHGIRTANLSVGTDVSKTRWGPQEIVYKDVMHVRPRRRARAAYAGYKLAKEARADPRFERFASLLGKRTWE